ncbi:MAG: hypothetical protein IKK93_11990 [Campylobacter sp.]|nr:hypothetical protein [Campylobacter sp.]
MEQLKDIVIDVLGDFVDPKRIEIIARPGNKYWILCNCIIPIGVYSAQEMINNRIEGTDLEGKVFVYEAS